MAALSEISGKGFDLLEQKAQGKFSEEPEKIDRDFSRNPPEKIKGFVNLNLSSQKVFNAWKKRTESVFSRFGFSSVELRTLEQSEHLSVGGIEKQALGLRHSDTRPIKGFGIPFDHTIPLAIFAAQNFKEINFPFKRQHMGQVLRAESSQNIRSFYQADVDIIGPQLDLSADAECLAAIMTTLHELEIGSFTTYLNHMEIVHGILDDFFVDESIRPEVLSELGKRTDKTSEDELLQNLAKILPDKSSEEVQRLIAAFSFKGSIDEFPVEQYSQRVQEGVESLREIRNMLLFHNIEKKNIQFSPRILRSLDYYTGLIFKTFLDGRGAVCIAGGGRYDRLVESFNSKLSIKGVGGAIGLSRIFDMLDEVDKLPRLKASTTDVFVGYRTQEQRRFAIRLATQLREAGVKVSLYTNTDTIENQQEFASKINLPVSVFVMDENSYMVSSVMGDENEVSLSSQEETVQRITEFLK